MKYNVDELAAEIEKSKVLAKERDLHLRTVTTSDDLLQQILDSSNDFDPWRIHILNKPKGEFTRSGDSNFCTPRCSSLYFTDRGETMIVNIKKYIFRINGTVINSISQKKYGLDLHDVTEPDLFSLSTIYDDIDIIFRFKELFLTLDNIRLKLKTLIAEKYSRDIRAYEQRHEYYGKDYDLRSLL